MYFSLYLSQNLYALWQQRLPYAPLRTALLLPAYYGKQVFHIFKWFAKTWQTWATDEAWVFIRLSPRALHILSAGHRLPLLRTVFQVYVYIANSLGRRRESFLPRKGQVCLQPWKDKYNVSSGAIHSHAYCLKKEKKIWSLGSRFLLHNYCMFRCQLGLFHHPVGSGAQGTHAKMLLMPLTVLQEAVFHFWPRGFMSSASICDTMMD